MSVPGGGWGTTGPGRGYGRGDGGGRGVGYVTIHGNSPSLSSNEAISSTASVQQDGRCRGDRGGVGASGGVGGCGCGGMGPGRGCGRGDGGGGGFGIELWPKVVAAVMGWKYGVGVDES